MAIKNWTNTAPQSGRILPQETIGSVTTLSSNAVVKQSIIKLVCQTRGMGKKTFVDRILRTRFIISAVSFGPLRKANILDARSARHLDPLARPADVVDGVRWGMGVVRKGSSRPRCMYSQLDTCRAGELCAFCYGKRQMMMNDTAAGGRVDNNFVRCYCITAN